MIRGSVFPVQTSSTTAATTTSVALPNRAVSSSSFNGYESSWEWLDGETGAVLGTSGWYSTRTEAASTPDSNIVSTVSNIGGTLGGIKAGSHVVNASGELLLSSGVPSLVCHTDLTSNVAGTCKHYLQFMPITNGTMSLKMSGSVPDITATWNCADSAATVETALQTAFSGYYDSLTVTGGAINTTGLIVDVVWTYSTEYFSYYGVSYSAFYDLIGNAFTRNLQTGIVGNAADTGGVSSSYRGAQCWQSETDVWRQGADPSNAANKRMESWDASTDPWTLTWYKQPWVGKTTIDPESRFDGIPFLIDLASNGTHNAVSFQLTSNGLGGTTALMTWNASDGTGEEKYPSAFSTPSLAGDYPYGLTFEDGGTDIACYYRKWRDADRWANFANLAVVASHYGSNGDDWVRMSSGSSPAVSHRLNLGDYTFANMAGFNDTHAAFCRIGSSVNTHEKLCEIMNSTGSTADSLCQTLAGGPTGSGIYDPDTLEEVNYWDLRYIPFTTPNNMISSTTQWRLRWTNRSDLTTEVTSWFDRDETIANVNSDLLDVFGTSAAAFQNVYVESLGPPAIIGTVPVFQQSVQFVAYGVKTSDEADVLETHPVFTFFAANATAALSLMPIITVEFQNFADERTGAYGSLLASDRSEAWAKNWTTSNNKNVLGATLKDGLMYLFGDRVCAEDFAGLTLEDEETTTPPYAVSSDTASFDLTFRNLTGVALTSLTLTKAHDGNGSLNSPTMPSTLAVGESATVTLTYSTSTDSADVTLTVHVTGTKPDATTVDSNELSLLVDIDPLLTEPPADPPP